MIPPSVKILIPVHIAITLVGLVAHINLHPPTESLFFWWPVLTGALGLLVVPVLYVLPATVAWGFLFNAMAVVIGTLGMAYFSLLSFEGPVTLVRIITESTLPKILFLWIKLAVGWFILGAMRPLQMKSEIRGCRP